MSHLLTVVPSNIEKWKGKGISTASVPFEKPGGGERNRTRGREKQNYQAFKLGGERAALSREREFRRLSSTLQRSSGRPPDSCQINIFVEE